MTSSLFHINPQAHTRSHTSTIKKEDYFHQQIALKPMEETMEISHLENGSMWCCNWDTSERT